MNHLRKILLAGLMANLSVSVWAGTADMENLLIDTTEIFAKMIREEKINKELLKDAKGVVILNATGFGIIIGGSGGDGILLARTPEGWSGPCAFTTAKGSFGIRVGGSNNDIIILLMNAGVVDRWAKGGHFTDAFANAAFGPNGATTVDADMKKRDFNVYIMEKSGFDAGVGFGGFDVNINNEFNANFYDQAGIDADDIISGRVKVPAAKTASLDRLYNLLKK